MFRRLCIGLLAIGIYDATTSRADTPEATLAKELRKLEARVIVLGTVRQPPLASMLTRDLEARFRIANRDDRMAWDNVKIRPQWEAFRDARLRKLRDSLGEFPPRPKDLNLRITRSLEGDGYRVDNLLYQTRPGLVVTANMYRPAKSKASMPAILICHSHQSAKHTGWRQDMAMTWARAGCVVLVPDHLGHGERRQHPFGGEGPHDYHFRYDAGIQLHLVGESLMGWLVYDMMRGVDVLLAQKNVDQKRLLVISEPAGGGDVAAVTAALDDRITGVMVQNFGGPEPETPYPLPKDAEEFFDYAGVGTWESTRNLRLSARDGFLPWQIVASVAPRRLIYYHEFYWDKETDPVWKRLQRIYGFYGASDALIGLAGRGFVVGSAPENSHWLPMNRELLYPVLERWFAIPNPKKEYSGRRELAELISWTPEAIKEFRPFPLQTLSAQLGAQRSAAARKRRDTMPPVERRLQLRKAWCRLLGDVAPPTNSIVQDLTGNRESLATITIERLHLKTDPGIVAPILLLLPPRKKGERLPVVVGLAQQGKQEFLRQRSEVIAKLLTAGVAVCLPDVRGTGETSPGEERGRRSATAGLSSSEWMLGQSLLGGQLRDLQSVLLHLRKHAALDDSRIALWGDSFAKVNAAGTNFKIPHTGDRPPQSEPLGGLLALLGALLDDDIHAVYVHRGLSDYQSVLESPYCYIPHDVVVPGVLAVGDICDVAGSIAPRPLWLDGMVDGLNRNVSDVRLKELHAPARAAYTAVRASDRLRLETSVNEIRAADWLIEQLRTSPR